MPPFFEINVSGTRRSVTKDAIVDTGFDGDVCIPLEVAVRLGLELRGVEQVELADGSHKEEMYSAAHAVLLGKRREVKAFVTNGEEMLLGTTLMNDCRLTIDFPTDTVKLVRRPRTTRK